jgi:hypothetical protein
VEDAVGFRSLIENLPADRSVPILVQRENGPVFLALKAAGD